jgi:hypothetical protein
MALIAGQTPALRFHFLDMRPARVLHERPRSHNIAAAEPNPGEKGRAFCDRPNDATRFAQPR